MTSYTNIASLFSQIQIEDKHVAWLFLNYFNLRWEKMSNTLIPCGHSIFNNYLSILNCPFLTVMIEPIQDFSYENVDLWINSGYNILLPINTQKMGVTENEVFVHDILITALNKNHYEVYDFWRPSFKWSPKWVEAEQVRFSVDDSNSLLFNKLILLKPKQSYECTVDNKVIKLALENYCNLSDKAELQDTGNTVYSQFIQYINETESPKVLAATNFQILVDHFTLLQTLVPWILKVKFTCKHDVYMKVENHITVILNHAINLRNYALKIWYRSSDNNIWKSKINNSLQQIQQQEKELLELVLTIVD